MTSAKAMIPVKMPVITPRTMETSHHYLLVVVAVRSRMSSLSISADFLSVVSASKAASSERAFCACERDLLGCSSGIGSDRCEAGIPRLRHALREACRALRRERSSLHRRTSAGRSEGPTMTSGRVRERARRAQQAGPARARRPSRCLRPGRDPVARVGGDYGVDDLRRSGVLDEVTAGTRRAVPRVHATRS